MSVESRARTLCELPVLSLTLSTQMAYFLSRGDTCVLRLRFTLLIGSGPLKPRLPRTAPRSSRTAAHKADTFGDRWSQRACRDCLR